MPVLSRLSPRARPVALCLGVLLVLAGYLGVARPVSATGTPLSQGKPTTASSTENATFPPGNATDGNTGTRWSSAFSDPQWIQVDLGAPASISQVVLVWEAAYATGYRIDVSNDSSAWSTVYATSTGRGGTETLNVTGTGRYVRMYGTARGTPYGYSLWELQVFGSPTTSCDTATDSALGVPATASSTESGAFPPGNAVDGNTGTRWSSAFSDPQWIQLDLGATRTICQVVLSWEAAYATGYRIDISNDANTWTTAYATSTGRGGTETLDVTGTGRYVRMYGTARATPYGYSLWEIAVHAAPTQDTGGFWGDPSTIPPAQNVLMVKVLNRTNGRYPDSQVYWSFNGVTHSVADQPYLDMPVNSAGRMYFYLGTPGGPYFDFIEFTVGASVFNGNTTRVDAFGLKLAMRLHAHDGYDVSVGEDLATFQEDRAVTFQRFVNEVPQEFKVLAQSQAPYRIIAPGSDPSFRAGGVNASYFTAYAQSVGINAATSDIFGCAGVLASDPGHCAALNRHVAQLPQAQWSDPSRYYQTAPANYYARFWHDHAINHLAYGFPYDDYAGQSSFISHGNPQWLEVAVGW